MRPSNEIAYTLVLFGDEGYQLRITAENAAPIIVGNFANKREAQSWMNAEQVSIPDQQSTAPTPDHLNRIRRWRAKAEEIRTAAELVTNKTAGRTLLQLARDYEALAESWEKTARENIKRSGNPG